MQNRFDIYFCGETLNGHEEAAVRAAVAELFKLPAERIDRLFSGKPVKIKQDLDIEKAGKYRAAFTKAGAIIHIVVAGSPFIRKETEHHRRPAQKRIWRLMPPGALLEPLARNLGDPPDISEEHLSQLQVAPAGPLPQNDEPPAELSIDISQLSALPPGTGSLEAFAVHKDPVPLPDISELKIDTANQPLSDPNALPPPAKLPDTSHLQVAPAHSGTLEEYAVIKEPVPIPDISALSLQNP